MPKCQKWEAYWRPIYDWVNQNRHKYLGQWVALDEDGPKFLGADRSRNVLMFDLGLLPELGANNHSRVLGEGVDLADAEYRAINDQKGILFLRFGPFEDVPEGTTHRANFRLR